MPWGDDSSIAADTVRLQKRRPVLSAFAVLAATLVVVFGLVVPAIAASPLHDGHGTAIISWHGKAELTKTGFREAFTGDIDGLTVKGTNALHVDPSTDSFSFDVTGTAAGNSFTLVLHPPSTVSGSYSLTGHFGKLAVKGTLSKQGTNGIALMKGTVGAYRVSGHIGKPLRHGQATTVSVTFDVSSG